MEFNLLPLEVQLNIFSYLSIRKVMAIRLVCKQWANLVNSKFKFEMLRCCQQSISDDRKFEFYFKYLGPFVDYTINDRKFSKIQYLGATLNPKFDELELAFEFLNSFKSLVETRFACIVDDEQPVEVEKKQFEVNLDRLDSLTIILNCGSYPKEKISIFLDTPNLVHLSVNSFKQLIIGHPEKLRSLSSYASFKEDVDYSQFTSLTHMFVVKGKVRPVYSSYIEKLPSLKELHFGAPPIIYAADIAKSSHSNKLKIYYFGFEISIDQINLEGERIPDESSFFDPFEEKSALFVIRNRHKSIENNRLIKSANYNLMANELDDSEMFAMMQKFPWIQGLLISGNVVDQDRLLKFIDKFKLECLCFERTDLPKSFFRRLSTNRPLIKCLCFKFESSMNPLEGDFDFIFEFKSLARLDFVGFKLPLHFVARVYEKLNKIHAVTFCLGSTYDFKLNLSGWPKRISLSVGESEYIEYKLFAQEVPEFIRLLKSELSGDGYTCPVHFQILLRHLEIEKENHLFMSKKYIYDHTHSICLSEEQMRLLNLIR